MATRPIEHETPTPPPAPATRTTPDTGSANAADKPFHERPGHAGAAQPPATRQGTKD